MFAQAERAPIPTSEINWPEKMTLAEIALEPDESLRLCLVIMYSQRTSTWEKNFARDNAVKLIWRIEHHWMVPSEQAAPSEKVLALLNKICKERKLDSIDFDDYRSKLPEGYVDLPC